MLAGATVPRGATRASCVRSPDPGVRGAATGASWLRQVPACLRASGACWPRPCLRPSRRRSPRHRCCRWCRHRPPPPPVPAAGAATAGAATAARAAPAGRLPDRRGDRAGRFRSTDRRCWRRRPGRLRSSPWRCSPGRCPSRRRSVRARPCYLRPTPSAVHRATATGKEADRVGGRIPAADLRGTDRVRRRVAAAADRGCAAGPGRAADRRDRGIRRRAARYRAGLDGAADPSDEFPPPICAAPIESVASCRRRRRSWWRRRFRSSCRPE